MAVIRDTTDPVVHSYAIREDWLFELEYDGHRCLARKAGARVNTSRVRATS